MDAVATLGAVLGVVLSGLALLAAAWRWVVLPNLREQLFTPVAETRRQVSENRHTNRHPTLMDRLDDVESSLDVVALNQLAILKRLGAHIGESTQDRAALWLIVESLTHERTPDDQPGDSGGA